MPEADEQGRRQTSMEKWEALPLSSETSRREMHGPKEMQLSRVIIQENKEMQ
jgi:hypothetical protein